SRFVRRFCLPLLLRQPGRRLQLARSLRGRWPELQFQISISESPISSFEFLKELSMQSIPVSMLSTPPAAARPRTRIALVASADLSFRKRLTQILIGLRWQVREAGGGAEAWAE